jgi:UDPglucose--hexose-1-phosphate uridylyltransferase
MDEVHLKMNESEIRQDKITKKWVIFAPARGKRPQAFKRPDNETRPPDIFDPQCPFCPGNEHMLPSITMEVPAAGNGPWQTRIVPNRFPAVFPSGDTGRYQKGIYLAMKGYGRHEVIIESPKHNQQAALMSIREVSSVIETYHRRYTDLARAHENMMVMIFRNHGFQAGTSLIHPHSQFIATGMVPKYIQWREEAAQRYFDEWGRCVYCEIIEFESRDRRRVIFENPSFLAFVPFAAEVPFEILIMPKKHRADFGHVSDEEKSDLAEALQNVLSRLYKKLNDPDYNYVIHTASRYRADEIRLHWYLQIRPRLTTRAGFEIGSGISINPSFPENDADFLNGISSGIIP